MGKSHARLGLIARSDGRGLGNQSLEVYRHLKPERTLVVDMGTYGQTPYAEHHDRYPDALVTPWDPATGYFTDPSAIEWLLDGSDVVHIGETPYDFGLLDRARHRGIPTIIHGNFEFMRWVIDPNLALPTLFLAPSPWRIADWPPNTEPMPVPVARDRLPFRLRTEAGRFLHIGGHAAIQDRNGTRLLLAALAEVRHPIRVLIRSQSDVPRRRVSTFVDLDVRQEDVRDYWDLYSEGDVLLAPRRFGGLSLPQTEAMSTGMPIMTTAMEPNDSWLPREGLVPVSGYHAAMMPVGLVKVAKVNPTVLARHIEQMAADPAMVERLSKESDAIAERLSWDVWLPRYRDLFDRVAAAGLDYRPQ